MRWLILVLAATVGCDRWATCEDHAAWSVGLYRGGTTEGAGAIVLPHPDGSLFVVTVDAGDTELGGMLLNGPHLARIEADGQISGVAVAGGGAYAVGAAADDAGGGVVAWGQSNATLVGYGADLAPRWTVTSTGLGYGIVLDAGPAGEAAFLAQDAGGQQHVLHYLAPDGHELWTADDGYVTKLRIADNGDLFVFRNDLTRARHAAATGAVIEVVPVSIQASVIARDGSYLAAGYARDGSPRASFERYRADGSRVWARVFDVQGLGSVIESSDGDVLAVTTQDLGSGRNRVELRQLAGDTGEDRAIVEACSFFELVAADPTGYVVRGITGSPSSGIARLPL
jgi:hypothetical protein